MQPVAWVPTEQYVNFDLNSDVKLAEEVRGMLDTAGFEVALEPDFEQIHDTFMILKWMFPGGRSLPHCVVSHNARWDPHFHLRMGAALRPLRNKALIIGSGGAVHNLYRNAWFSGVFYRDSLTQTVPPEQWAIDFGEAFSNVVTQNSGPALRRGIARLMAHPQFRDAQGTDDHYMAALFVAGAAGALEDEGHANYAGAENYELQSMRNVSFVVVTVGGFTQLTCFQSQFQFGDWPQAPHVTPVRAGMWEVTA